MIKSDTKILHIKKNGSHDKAQELEIYSDINDLESLLAHINEELFINTKNARLFNETGNEIFDMDVQWLKHNQLIYFDSKGGDFNTNNILNAYDLQEKLGEGGFGKVYFAEHKETLEKLAIKFMDISDYMKTAHSVQEIYKEALALQGLNHRNIIKLHHAFILKTNVVLIMEYAGGGDLMGYLNTEGSLKELEARTIFSQMMDAVGYCHHRGIIHRDLKLDNLLFSDKEDRQIKLVDFGIAGSNTGKDKDHHDMGTGMYMSPELLGGNTASEPTIDIWAMGIILYVLLYGAYPFSTEDAIMNAKFKFPPDKEVSKEYKDIIGALLEKDPEKRIRMMELTEHPWFAIPEEELQALGDKEPEKIEEPYDQRTIEELLKKIKGQKIGYGKGSSYIPNSISPGNKKGSGRDSPKKGGASGGKRFKAPIGSGFEKNAAIAMKKIKGKKKGKDGEKEKGKK